MVITLSILSLLLFASILYYIVQECKTNKLVNERQAIIDSLVITGIEFKYDLKVTNICYLN